MAKYAKWIGAILGWFLTRRPWGAILGFIIGSMIDEAQVTVKRGRTSSGNDGMGAGSGLLGELVGIQE